MANPNIVSVSSIKGESLGFALTATTTTTLMTASADKVLKINRITCANVDGSSSADLTLSITKSNFTPDGVANFDTSCIRYTNIHDGVRCSKRRSKRFWRFRTIRIV